MILYDEDPGAKLSPDRLGKAVARFGPNSDSTKEGSERFEAEYTLQKRKGVLHPYILTYLTALLPGEKLRKHSRVFASVRVLRKDADQKDDRRLARGYGRRGEQALPTTFIANKFQLTGPVPVELRRHYVGYRPFINWMFGDSYRTVHACDKSVGVVDDTGVNTSNTTTPQTEEPTKRSTLHEPMSASSEALAREDAKLFTYGITLDGEWRFTETGPEFAIDLSSKHSMHADLALEIAYSILSENTNAEKRKSVPEDEIKPPDSGKAGPSSSQTADQPPPSRDPKDYELIIDNDSGTYPPKKELLPVLEKWLSDPRRLGGLGSVKAMDEKLKKMKEERTAEKAELTGVGKGRDADKPANSKLVPVRKGLSANSISSGQVRASSVSGNEVEDALKKTDNPDSKAEKA
ncbi:hypothetical protein DFH09DRAFT_1451863 [Mycena vulgaris]|nr:hypothetical protein DFH09DRAFT_1451863 [Mycena vulgaris]